jgi:hypothetical protein
MGITPISKRSRPSANDPQLPTPRPPTLRDGRCMIDEDNVIRDFAFSIFKRVRAISWDRKIGNGKPAFSIESLARSENPCGC